jgi:hypothetical protein
MGLIKTALKTAVAVKTANVVHDRIQRRKQAEWVAAGNPPETFQMQHLGDATAGIVGAGAAWLGGGSATPTPTPTPDSQPAAPAVHPSASGMAQAAPAAAELPTPYPGSTDPILAQLHDLAALKQSGMLTDEEFAAQKRRILGA